MQTEIHKSEKYIKKRQSFFKNFAVFIYIFKSLCYNKNRDTKKRKGEEKMKKETKEKIKEKFKKIVEFLLNPRFCSALVLRG